MKLTTILGTNLTIKETRYTDLTYLKEIAEGSNEFLKKMIDTFIEQTPPVLENMERALKEEKWEELRLNAHKIKPSIDFMGIHSAWEAVKKVERFAAEQSHLDILPGLVEEVNRVCYKAIEELKEEARKYS